MGLGYKALADDLEELIPNTPTSIGGLSHRLQHEGMPRTAAVIERLPAILSALRKAGEMEAALRAAEQFIVNGVDLFFIRLPESADDPAHLTLPMIRSALKGASTRARRCHGRQSAWRRAVCVKP